MPESFLLLSIILVLMASMVIFIVGIQESRLWLTMSNSTWNITLILRTVCVAGLVWKLVEVILRLIGG